MLVLASSFAFAATNVQNSNQGVKNTPGAITNLVTTFLNGVAMNTEPILKWFLGDTPTGELLLVKFLFFIILLAIIYYAVRQVPTLGDNSGVTWIISIITSILAIRLLSESYLIEFIWLPTGVLGITLICILPFIIFFYFIESFDASLVRKVGWSLFTLVYIMLAMLRWKDLATGQNGIFGLEVNPVFANLGWVYLITAVLAILAVFLDRPVRKMIIGSQAEATRGAANLTARGELREEIKRLSTALANAPNNKEASKIKKRIRDIERRIKELY